MSSRAYPLLVEYHGKLYLLLFTLPIYYVSVCSGVRQRVGGEMLRLRLVAPVL